MVNMPGRSGPSIWSNSDFMLLWCGRSVSALGSSVSGIAFPLLILILTGSPGLAGLGGGLGAIPSIFLGLPAGVLADHWDKKRAMVLCELGRAMALGSIPVALWSGHLSLVQLYAAIIIEGTLRVFYGKASLVARTLIVPPWQFAATSAQDEASYYTAGLVGPSAGGLLYQVGQALPFLADALSYLLSALSLLLLRANLRARGDEQPDNLGAEVRAGLSWVWRTPLVRSVSLLQGGQALLGSGLSLLVIVLARQGHATPAEIGVIFSISAVGGIFGALIGGRVPRLVSFGPTILGVTWLLALLWPLYAIAPNIATIGIITAAIYILNPVRNVALVTYEIPLIPHEVRGRVLGVSQTVPDAMSFAGPPLMGIGIQAIGPAATVIVGTAIAILLALFVTLNPYIRNAPPLPARAAKEI